MADPGVRVVVDVGTGAVSRVARRKPPTDVRIIGVDRTHESMVGNDDVDEKRVADVVAQGLPFSDGEVDLVTSVSVLEHLANVPQLVRNPSAYSAAAVTSFTCSRVAIPPLRRLTAYCRPLFRDVSWILCTLHAKASVDTRHPTTGAIQVRPRVYSSPAGSAI